MPDQNILLSWAVPVFILLIALEARTSWKRQLGYYQLADSLTSLACGVMMVTVEVFTASALLLLFAWISHHYGLFLFPTDSVWTWLLFFLVLDFLYYWAHRWSHKINFLWAVHVPHHQSEEYNLTTALRLGAFEDTFHRPIFLPMALLGCPAEVFIVLLNVHKFYQFWIHTRLIDKVPLIEGILNTPSAHRVHHAVNDAYVDRNHGGTLMIWDKLFGTWIEEGEPCVYGVRKPYHRWDGVRAQFDWFGWMWNAAKQAGSVVDRLRIPFMPTGWRPADVEAREPAPLFSLGRARLQHFTATSTGRWKWLAVSCFVLALIFGKVLMGFSGTLSTTIKVVLAVYVVLLLLAMAWALDPRRG
jgi:sterol desaturase/sphingolipid hydroxylase (fatty acid hydroxylase superfamily)